MTRWLDAAGKAALLTALVLTALLAPPARGDAPPPAPRVEARSAELLAVGVVKGDRMTIHITRLMDNAPIRDASLSVLLRGVAHPTVAEVDGGYAFESSDLAVPGNASLVFEIVERGTRSELNGELVGGGAAEPEKDSARQLWWWALNFAVCIGFLMLLSRRRKRQAQSEP